MQGLQRWQDTDRNLTGYWSILVYDRLLTDEEIKQYSLDYLCKEKGGFYDFV